MMFITINSYLIKDVAERDIDGILNVYRNCEDFLSLGPVSCASEQMVLEDLKHSREEGGIYCGVYSNGEMIGVVDFVPNNYKRVPNQAYISLLMIAMQHRRQGLGKQIVRAVEDEIIKNKQIERILSGVQINNLSAINFWFSAGYKIIAGPALMPDSTTCYQLEKRIVGNDKREYGLFKPLNLFSQE